MKHEDIRRLGHVANALYLREMRGLPQILAAESRLRTDLARLDNQAARARADLGGDPTMKSVGADLLWQGWEAQTRRRLNLELAQVVARKLTTLDGVRAAFGRQQALKDLDRQMMQDRHARRARQQAERLLTPMNAGPGEL